MNEHAPTQRRALVAADPGLHGPASRYLDRELSQLEFNLRVLELARSSERPLLERLKFVAISASNTDEFFQKRIGGLRAQAAAGVRGTSRSGLRPPEQLEALAVLADRMSREQARMTNEVLFPALGGAGFPVRTWEKLEEVSRVRLSEYFDRHVYPILTPLAIDPGRPFPHISSLSVNLMVVLVDPEDGTGARRFARVKLPASLPRYVFVDDPPAVVPLEEVVAAHLEALFVGMTVLEHHPFRVTRNADVALESGEVDDLLETIEERLLRRRFGEVVRLEVCPDMAVDVRARLLEALRVTEAEVYEAPGPIAGADLMSIYAQGPDRLKDPPWRPAVPPRLASASDPFARIRDEDILVHHPYESFDASVGALVKAAAEDPKVAAIKLTIYRTSESESSMVDALIRAARAGKQAVAMVELKARFDEETNIARARRLEEAGVHVVYGFVGLKAHTKTLLIIREEEGGVRRYVHVGTGNYNPKTARLYEDLGLFTADPGVGRDLGELFNILTGFSRQRGFRKLLVAPRTMRPRLLELIGGEAREGGRVVIKINNLVDEEMIEALYEASGAGANIELIVRSQCCLRPGVEGMSDRIRVRSVLGEFLEHSRIYRFGAPGEGAYYIGSADVMGRNLDRRFEALVAVEDPALRARLDRTLDAYLEDEALAWTLGPDGTWYAPPNPNGPSVHARLKAEAQRADRSA